MESIHRFQSAAADKSQQLQAACDARGFGHWSTAVAGSMMLFVFCPMSFVALAAPYWSQGNPVSSRASLWEVSTSSVVGGRNVEVSVGMCSEEMQDTSECGKIRAIRVLLIAASPMSMASAVVLMIAFSPRVTAVSRKRLLIVGASLSTIVLFLDLLAMFVAASVKMSGGIAYKLNGMGFVFLVLELLFVSLASFLAVLGGGVKTLTGTARSPAKPEIQNTQGEKAVADIPRTLLTTFGARSQNYPDAAKTGTQVVDPVPAEDDLAAATAVQQSTQASEV